MSSGRESLNLTISKELKKKAKIKSIQEGTALTYAIEAFLESWVAGKITLPKDDRVAA